MKQAVSSEILTLRPLVTEQAMAAEIDDVRSTLPLIKRHLIGATGSLAISKVEGYGLDTFDTREMVPGDDASRINAYATATRGDGKIMVDEPQDEVTPRAWLITDTVSERYGARVPGYTTSKQNLAMRALLTTTVMANRDSMAVGLVAHDGDDVEVRKPGMGSQWPMRLADMLVAMQASASPGGQNRLSETLDTAHDRLRKRKSSLVVVSDFRDESMPSTDVGWGESLAILQKSGHDIIAIEVSSPWDKQLPEQVSTFVDGNGTVQYLEGRKGRVIRQSFTDKAIAKQAAIDETLVGLRHVKLDTMDPHPIESLVQGIISARPASRR
jgi:uncharacterized protein (DUF58 family)